MGAQAGEGRVRWGSGGRRLAHRAGGCRQGGVRRARRAGKFKVRLVRACRLDGQRAQRVHPYAYLVAAQEAAGEGAAKAPYTPLVSGPAPAQPSPARRRACRPPCQTSCASGRGRGGQSCQSPGPQRPAARRRRPHPLPHPLRHPAPPHPPTWVLKAALAGCPARRWCRGPGWPHRARPAAPPAAAAQTRPAAAAVGGRADPRWAGRRWSLRSRRRGAGWHGL